MKLRNLIELEEDVCICGPVLAEVLQGLRHEDQYRKVSRILQTFDYLETTREVYQHAADIYRELRAKGVTIRSTMDCIIAATAHTHDVHLVHHDRDFDKIARHFPLRVL